MPRDLWYTAFESYKYLRRPVLLEEFWLNLDEKRCSGLKSGREKRGSGLKKKRIKPGLRAGERGPRSFN